MKILAMTRPRQGALKKLSRHTEKIQEHIIKCVVYPDSQSYRHWIYDELANWFYQADRVKCDSKLKEKDYRDTVFGMIGTTLGEALEDLEDFKEDFVENSIRPYPDFIIDNKLSHRLYQSYQEIIVKSIRQFMSKDVATITEWYEILNNCMK